MSNKEKKSPELRFKGFSDDWEQRKVADLGQISAGGDIKNDKLDNNGQYPVFANSLQNQGNIGYYNEYKYTFPAVTVTGRGDIGKAIARHENFNAVVRLLVISLYEGYDANFLAKAINNMTIYIESTGVPQLTAPQLSNYRILIPKFFEQKTIGTFFLRLDNIINLHQRKISILKKLKQEYLSLMFPQKNKNTPRLRFDSFKGVWDQCTLNTVYNVTMGHSPRSENYTSNPTDHILVQGNADIINGRVSPRVWTSQITKLIKAGSILLSVRAPVGNVGKTDYDVVIGRGIAAFEGDEFLYQLLHKMHIQGYWKRFSTGSTFESINSNDIKEAPINLPVQKEREKIGRFLEMLDSYITLSQNKVSKLKKIKSTYLHKMFL